jgi:hypothetical protein
MKKRKKGDAMLLVMTVMLVIMGLGSGHMGMKDDGTAHAHAEKPGSATQPVKADSSQAPSTKGSSGVKD